MSGCQWRVAHVVTTVMLWAALSAGVWGDGVKSPVPGDAEQASAREQIHEVFRDEYQQSPSERGELARQLLERAGDEKANPALHYVMLCEARDLAMAAGEVDIALQAIERMGWGFDVEVMRLQVELLTSAGKTAGTGAMNESVVRGCLAVMEERFIEDDFEGITKLTRVTESAAGKCQNAKLEEYVKERLKEYRRLRAAQGQVMKARKTLASAPDDPAANGEVGRYLCHEKEDWANGLPHLAKGQDATLRGLAGRDLANAIEAAERVATGDAWWEHSQTMKPGSARNAEQRRAAYWYGLALAETVGLRRDMLVKRMEEAEYVTLKGIRLERGLHGEYFSDRELAGAAMQRMDEQVDFEWGMGSPAKELEGDDFSARWTGFLCAPSAGDYSIAVMADKGARVWIDGRLVVDAWGGASKQEARVMVTLPDRPVSLRIEYFEERASARMKLHWSYLQNSAEHAVPASALFHDPFARNLRRNQQAGSKSPNDQTRIPKQ